MSFFSYPLEGSGESGDNKKKGSKLGRDHPTGHRRAQQVNAEIRGFVMHTYVETRRSQ